MKDINQYIKESIMDDDEDTFDNKKVKSHMWELFCFREGFGFGSIRISDNKWYPFFDMDYIRNYYQKYCDYDKVKITDPRNADIFGKYEGNNERVKFPKTGNTGLKWFAYNEAAVVFAIMDMEIEAANVKFKDIEARVSKFLSKNNKDSKETKIEAKQRGSRIVITLVNPKIFPLTEIKPLTIELEYIKHNK